MNNKSSHRDRIQFTRRENEEFQLYEEKSSRSEGLSTYAYNGHHDGRVSADD